MHQPVLPLVPAESRSVGPSAALLEDADGGAVFVFGMLTFVYAAGDDLARRLAAVQLARMKIATKGEVASAFAVTTTTLARWCELPLNPWRLLQGGWAVFQGQVLAGRVVDLVAGELLEKYHFLAAGAGAAGAEALAGPVAVVAPLLAQVTAVAAPAGVDGAVAA